MSCRFYDTSIECLKDTETDEFQFHHNQTDDFLHVSDNNHRKFLRVMAIVMKWIDKYSKESKDLESVLVRSEKKTEVSL